MKKLILATLLSFSITAFGDMTAKDWHYEEYYTSGAAERYDAWTQALNFRSFVTTCNVNYRKGDPSISFFIATTDPIHNRGEDIVVTLKFGKTHFELPAKVSTVNPTNVYVYPFIDQYAIIDLMQSETAFDIFIPVAAGAAHIRQNFSLMGFSEASLTLRKVCRI